MAPVVDFKKLTKRHVEAQVTDPIKLYYEKLEPASNTGPLRPAQAGILAEWRDKRCNDRDLVLKLHTGDGKTLVGLLICQSQLNAGKGPALYLCPNKYLVAQTCDEANRFGINIVTAEPELPTEFLDSQKILVTTAQKLFNGLTKFGIGTHSQKIGTLLMDDAHACVDAIRDAFTINVERDAAAYRLIRDLFADTLRKQGSGTFADIESGDSNAILMVPYWAWQEKNDEVVKILASVRGADAVKYVWPLLKDRIRECVCLVSGTKLQITPYLPPLDEFGTYTKASTRIFMSATTANDAFLIRGLGLAPSVVQKPLTYEKQKWLGEKMILIPSLIDDSLDRSEIVNWLGKPRADRKFGIVALVPGFFRTKDWSAVGAQIVETGDIEEAVARLRKGECEKAVVLVNRYDGIDLPDKACRILIVDSKPVAETLLDRYMADCVAGSEMITAAIMRKIEQGLGRSVRGEKDSSIILLIGADLIALLRTGEGRRFLSAQTQRQIEIGLEVARLAKEEVQDGKAKVALTNVMNQSLLRDDGWREYYKEEMNGMVVPTSSLIALSVFELERTAEMKFQDGDIDGAIAIVQKLGNESTDLSVQGWYVQEKARYEYARSATESDKLQAAAHKRNRRLLKPRTGMDFKRIIIVNQKRPELIKEWVVRHGDGEQLQVHVAELLDRLQFGVAADRFEAAWDELGRALGFLAERPDKDWGEGPDNLWALRANQYLLAEAKSEIEVTRAEIHKDESQQMNNSSAWFAKNYGDVPVKRLIIHPAQKLSKSAAFRDDVEIMSQARLDALRKAVRSFFREFANLDFAGISERNIEQALAAHKLTIDDVLSLYSKKAISFGRPRN